MDEQKNDEKKTDYYLFLTFLAPFIVVSYSMNAALKF